MSMAYPYNPAGPADITDFLRPLTQDVGTDTVTYASGTASAPSKPRSSFVLPKVGLASRIGIEVDVNFDYTAGGGSGAVAADGRGPFGIVKALKLTVNGKLGWYNVSGFGTYILNATESKGSFPQDAPGTAYTTAPTDVASSLFNYPVNADGHGLFSLEIPIIASPDNPLSMLLLQHDQVTAQLDIEWNTLDKYAALAGGASATATVTANVTLEYFEVPPIDVFESLIKPMMGFGHWFNETEQAITAQGVGANKVVMDNHDTYLGIFHTIIANSVLMTDYITGVKLILNTNQTRYAHTAKRQFKMQREQWGKDLPVIAWDMFSDGVLPHALDAEAYTAIESQIDIVGATLGADARILTIGEKLVRLS